MHCISYNSYYWNEQRSSSIEEIAVGLDMNRQFILRIEWQGRVNFMIVRGHREAMDLAHAYVAHDRRQQLAVLDATGRVVWQAAFQSAA